MNAFVACAALLFAAWLLRRRAVRRLERALVEAQGDPTVLSTLALALTRCVITLAAAAAAAYLVVAGSLVTVQWTGGDGLSWLKTLAARIAAARNTVEQVAGAWTAVAIGVLMLGYFLVARTRIARFRQLLSAAIDRQLEAIEAARAAGRWKVLDPSPEMIEIEADIAALENSLGTLGPQTPQAKAVKRQLEELWGRHYYADRARRVNLAQCIREARATPVRNLSKSARYITAPVTLRTLELGSKATGFVAATFLFASLIGVRAPEVAAAAATRMAEEKTRQSLAANDEEEKRRRDADEQQRQKEIAARELAILRSAQEAKASFERALEQVAAAESETSAPYPDDDEALNAAAMAFEQQWLAGTNLASGAAATTAEWQRLKVRGEVLGTFVRHRNAASDEYEAYGAMRRSETTYWEPELAPGKRFKEPLIAIQQKAPAAYRRIVNDVRKAGGDRTMGELSAVRRQLLASLVGKLFIAGADIDGAVLAAITNDGIEEASGKTTEALLDADVYRTAAELLRAKTETDRRRHIRLRGSASQEFVNRVVRPEALRSPAESRERDAAGADPMGRVDPAIGRADAASDLYEKAFPATRKPALDSVDQLAHLKKFEVARDAERLRAQPDVGGVVIGAEPEAGSHADIRALDWKANGRAVYLRLTRANGSVQAIGPFHAAVIAQALAYAADGRALAASIIESKTLLHPVLNRTALGERALRMDLFVFKLPEPNRIANKARSTVESQIDLYWRLLAAGRVKTATVKDRKIARDFDDETKTPFLTKVSVFDAEFARSVASCARRPNAALCSDAGMRFGKGTLRPDVAVHSGIHDTPFAITSDLRFVTTERPLEFGLELIIKDDLGRHAPERWSFPAASPQIDARVRNSVKTHAICGEILSSMNDFARLVRLFRAAFAGQLGEQFPVEKLSALAQETVPFVKTVRTPTGRREIEHPCRGRVPPL